MDTVEYKRINHGDKYSGNVFKIITKKGERDYPFDVNNEDRIILIEIDGKSWAITHQEQKLVLELVLKNDILEHVREMHCNSFLEVIKMFKKGERVNVKRDN